MYPDGEVSPADLGELLEVALEGRQRVRNQLHLMAPGEYGPIVLAGRVEGHQGDIMPILADAHRQQQVSLPTEPRVGEVTGLAVIGDDRGCLLHFEVQASKGNGRVINLGSMRGVMRESVTAAVQFLKTHAKEVGLPLNWSDDYDLAVLATLMGVPKEGPSAGITIVTGIVSAMKNRPVRHDVAMSGEITIMGKVLGVGGIVPKVTAAIDAGCKEVILPRENERDVSMMPEYLKHRVTVSFVTSIEEVLAIALTDSK
jgi:ATP-dependent Lon protease